MKPITFIMQVFFSLIFIASIMAWTVAVGKAAFVSPELVMKVITK